MSYMYKNNVVKSFCDDLAYMNFAENVLDQGPLIFDNSQLSKTAKIVGPGLPWIMALVMKFLGKGWLQIFIFNSIVSSLITVLLFFLGEKIFYKGELYLNGIVFFKT